MCTIFQIPTIYRNMQTVWINTQHVSLDFIQEISCYDFYKNTASNACVILFLIVFLSNKDNVAE